MAASVASERLQKISGEAFNRLRSDHEQFLEAYEKPTQIYRFINARHSIKPVFLHRNLSYMRHRNSRKGRKRLKKLKVDDLLLHTRDQKPDLAEEIKSDNHLQISFAGLEKGIDFEELLDAASNCKSKPGKKKKKTSETEGTTGKHENHQLEVEVMLYRFKQPVAETLMEAPRLSPYSHSSLGRFVLDYRANNKPGHKLSGRGIKGRGLTLSIPESDLTWKGGSRSSGTQMLVFRASPYLGGSGENKNAKASRRLSSSSSKKAGRKTVALELNRINPASLAKFQSQPSTPTQVVGDSLSSKASGGGEREATSRKSSTSSLSENVTISGPKVNGHVLTTAAGGANTTGTRSSSRINQSDGKHDEEMVIDSGDLDADIENNQRSSRKMKPNTKDMGVMTDLCGIDTVLDLSPVIPKSTDASATTTTTNGRKSTSSLRLSLQPTPSLTKGCTDRCTSPGFPHKDLSIRNGGFNGFTFNGYANPSVLKLRNEPEAYQRNRKKALSLLQRHANRHVKTLVATERNGWRSERRDPDQTVTHKDPETGEIRPCTELQGAVAIGESTGGGGRGRDVPFTISIPRMMLSPSAERQSESMNGVDDLDTREGETGEEGTSDVRKGGKNDEERSRSTMSPQKSPSSYKRRSEIQLLLDGDKPPSERISASEVPIFTAEDVTSRSSRNVAGGGSGGGQVNKPWLDSSTRKITPVEHFDYSFVSLTQKVTGLTNSIAGSGGLAGSTAAGSRKRSISDSDGSIGQPSAGSIAIQPPSKQPKLSVGGGGASSAVIAEEKDEEMSFQAEFSDHGGTLSPTHGPSSTLLTANDVIGDSSLDTEPSGKVGVATLKDSPFQADDVFASEVVVFDSRGDCLLQDGQYSILMQQCSKKETAAAEGESPELLTFPPLTWSSVFGAKSGSKQKSGKAQSQNIMLHFSVSWTHGPPQHRLCSEFDTALDFKKLREAYFPPQSTTTRPSPPHAPPLPLPTSLPRPHADHFPEAASVSSSLSELDRMSDTPLSQAPPTIAGKSKVQEFINNLQMTETDPYPMETPHPNAVGAFMTPPPAPPIYQEKLVFNFLYSNNTLQQTESRGEMRCPWCSLRCGTLYSLLKHMSLCHPRFQYTYTPRDAGPSVIDVHVNKMYDAGSAPSERDPGERTDISFFQRKNGPTKRIPSTALLVERHTDVHEDLSEFLNDGSWKRGYIANRIYHHSRSSLPMLPQELENESEEDEKSLEWHIICSQKMIDEFTDVNRGEKELMKLWNHFAMQNKLIAAKQLPAACLKFAKERREELIEKDIVQNFMTHLITLCDIGLINPTVLKDSMAVVYSSAAS